MSEQNSKDMEILYPEGKPVSIGDKLFHVKPFVLKNRIKFVRLFAEISIDAAKDPNFKNLNNLGVIIAMIEKAGEKLIDIYVDVLGADREWLSDNMQMKHEIEVIQAVMEINDLPLIISQIHNLIGQKKA